MSTIAYSITDLDPLAQEMSPTMCAAYEKWRQDHLARMGELSRRGMARKAASGVLPCCAPVGYRNVRKRIETDPVLAPLVHESFERAAASTLPLRALLGEMTEKGLVSRSGRPLKVSAFWYMLRNPLYTGMVNWKGNLIPGSHHPIVGQELFDAVRRRLEPAA